LGREKEETALRDYAQKVRENYNEKLLVQDEKGGWCYRSWEKREEGIVTTQACEALPLYWGMVPEDKLADVVECFRRTLTDKGAFVAGEVGLPYIIQSARKYGMNDLIASFITREQHPSYYAFVLDGMTTLGEYWETNPRSHCHDMMGHIIEWYFNGIAGIEISEPGFRKVRIHPWMPESMNRFVCRYETPLGTVVVSGRRVEGEPLFQISVPDGMDLLE
jgi:hypothetical protein